MTLFSKRRVDSKVPHIVAMLLAFASLLLAGCNYHKQQTGYLVTRSETFVHHYNINFAKNEEEGIPQCPRDEWECDKQEIRYTLIHKGVTITAQCAVNLPRSWLTGLPQGDLFERNKCDELRVSEAYHCRPGAGPWLSCGDKVILRIENSQMN